MRLHPSDELLDHGHVGIGEFALPVWVAGIERHAQVIQVLLVHAHLAACHHGLAQHDGALEEADVVIVLASGRVMDKLG